MRRLLLASALALAACGGGGSGGNGIREASAAEVVGSWTFVIDDYCSAGTMNLPTYEQGRGGLGTWSCETEAGQASLDVASSERTSVWLMRPLATASTGNGGTVTWSPMATEITAALVSGRMTGTAVVHVGPTNTSETHSFTATRQQ